MPPGQQFVRADLVLARLGLNGIQLRKQRDRHRCTHILGIQRRNEFPSAVTETAHPRGSIGALEVFVDARVSVGLHEFAFEAGQDLARPFALPRGRVFVKHDLVEIAEEGPEVALLDAGWVVAVQYRQVRVVEADQHPYQRVASGEFPQWFHKVDAACHPVTHRRGRKLGAQAPPLLGLAIKRCRVVVLVHQQLGQQSRSRPRTFNGLGRRLAHDHAFRALLAHALDQTLLDDDQLRGHEFQHLAHFDAHLRLLTAAVLAAHVLGARLDRSHLARQIRRKRFARRAQLGLGLRFVARRTRVVFSCRWWCDLDVGLGSLAIFELGKEQRQLLG